MMSLASFAFSNTTLNTTLTLSRGQRQLLYQGQQIIQIEVFRNRTRQRCSRIIETDCVERADGHAKYSHPRLSVVHMPHTGMSMLTTAQFRARGYRFHILSSLSLRQKITSPEFRFSRSRRCRQHRPYFRHSLSIHLNRGKVRVWTYRHCTIWNAWQCWSVFSDANFAVPDCVNFQEALLGQSVIFTAGIAEAKSKGRGEECISQNLRILRAKNGRQVILFFTNSQRKEKKRYITIPREYSRHPSAGFDVSCTRR